MNTLLESIKRVAWIRFILDVFARFGKDNGGLLAAGLAFFLVLAFVPMLLVGIWALGTFFAHSGQDPTRRIQDLLTTQILPGAAGHEVKDLMEKANVASTVQKITATRGLSGLIGLFGLIWSSMQIFVNGVVAMNAAWETTEKRNWLKLHVLALGLLVATGVLVVLSLAATAYGSYLSDHLHVAFITTMLTELGAVLISSLMYTIVYKFLPSAEVSWKAAAVGGLIAAVGWEIAKKSLATYLLHPNVSLYGNLANLIIFILWVYYSMMILLLGAEASVVYTLGLAGAQALKPKKALHHPTPSVDATAEPKHPMHGSRRHQARHEGNGKRRATPRG